jgi:hypothetical protein
MRVKLSIAAAKRTGRMGQKGGDELRIMDSVFLMNSTLHAIRHYL